MMIDVVQGYLIVLFEIICCKLFFGIFCLQSPKKNKWTECLLIGGMGILAGTIAYLGEDIFLWKELFLVVLFTVGMKIDFAESLKKSFILTVIYLSILLLVDYIVIILGTTILDAERMENTMVQSLMTILSKGILFLGIILIDKVFQGSRKEYLDDSIWAKFLFFPVFSICVLAALVFQVDIHMYEKQEQLFWFFAFGLAGMNIVIFYLMRDMAGKECELQEKRIFEREAGNQLKLYEAISNSIQEQREKTHEYQNQMACMQELFQNREYEKLGEYMEQINGSVLSKVECIDTNHVIVNAILNQKYQEAVEEGIVVTCKINDLSGISMEDQDVVLLLSNLLNNAITASAQCTTQKFIKIKLYSKEEFVIFSVRNSYQGKLKYKDRILQTTKKDKQNHGIGIKNMIRVIEKYGGSYVMEHKNNEFYFSIMIPQRT